MKQILALLVLFFCGCSPVDSEPEEYIDLASASPPASSVVEVEPTPSTPIAEEAPPAPVEERPAVRVYCQDPIERCIQCVRMKKELAGLSSGEKEALPVVFQFEEAVPEWVTVFPTLHWETPDGWVSVTGWNGLDKFLEVYGKPLSGSKKKDDITSQSEPSTANKSSPSSSGSEQHSSETAEAMPLSQSATASSSSSRKRRR